MSRRLYCTPLHAYSYSSIRHSGRLLSSRCIPIRDPRPLRFTRLQTRSSRYSTRQSFENLRSLQSGTNFTAVGLGILVAITAALAWRSYTGPDTSQDLDPADPQFVDAHNTLRVRLYPGMPPNIPPGRPGNLTPEQEAKLRELWEALFNLTSPRTRTQSTVSVDSQADGPDDESTADGAAGGKKKRRFFGSIRGRKSKGGKEDIADSASEFSAASGPDDKHGQKKEFREALANLSPQRIREIIWDFTKCDDPDACLCRYLRARKWNVNDALVMLISTIYWRGQVMKVDDDIMKNGEGAAAEAEKKASGEEKKLGEDFLAQLRMGKSFLHGTDRDGRPMCFVRVRLHRQGEQSEAALERYTVYTIETARFMLRPPVDTAVIVFDMTDFSMANMDYAPVKFMIKVFEANYPESLGTVLVHKSPWVFHAVWRIIHGWLDPVVASKVHFTKDVKELSEFIEPNKIPKELGGDEDWEYAYKEPITGENAAMADVEERDKVAAERAKLIDEYEHATIEWLRAHDGGSASASADELSKRRLEIADKLRANYWRLDPFIRARSLYDRTGIIREGGVIDMYPSADPAAKERGTGKGAGFGYSVFTSRLREPDEKSVKSEYYDASEDVD